MKSKDQQLLEEAYLKIVEAELSQHAQNYEVKKKRLAELARKSNRTKEEDRELAQGVGIPDTVDLDNWMTTSSGFRGLPEPEGGWPDRPDKKKSSAAKPKSAEKVRKIEPEEDDDLDVEGDPVGSYRSIATPEPEIETKVVSIPFELLDDIQTKDSELYTIITGVAKKVEQNGDNLNFTYSADKAADIEFFIQNYK